jgi:hypothetical protein
MRLSHSESGKVGDLGVLMILALTCLGLTDQARSKLRVACNSGQSSTLNGLLWMTQVRSDSLTFFFFVITASESIEEDLDSALADDREQSCDDLGGIGVPPCPGSVLPLFKAPTS